ncbi:MAG: molybdopterin-dependent oxidoreductase [Rhodoferax sp.]|nr:molybdopterin-dependent oxidoreductase [Rhodoferax sp.]
MLPHNTEPVDMTAPAVASQSRRNFLRTGLAVGSSFVLPLGISRLASAADASSPAWHEITDWVRIDSDGKTVIGLSQAEVGQGVYTGLPQVLADEMDANWPDVRVEFVTGRDAYRVHAANEEPQQFVGASMSATLFYTRLRVAGAQAREAFVKVAARRLGVRETQCTTRNGRVFHVPSSRSLGYGELAAEAAKVELNPTPKLKPASAHNLIGHAVKKLDSPAKVDGSAIYGIDVVVPGMLLGAIRMAPSLGGTQLHVKNLEAVRARLGVHEVVLAKDAVIVVADSYWIAKKGCDALDVEWKPGQLDFDSKTIMAQRQAALQSGKAGVATKIGDTASLLGAEKNVISADYHAPYLVHATMEPVNATVHVRSDSIEVWGPVQGQDKVRWALGAIFKMPPEKVIVNTTFLGGSFGRKYVPDFVIHAAVASKAVGKPVKVIRSREDDIRHGFYRPCASGRFSAVLGPDGLPKALHARIAGQSLYNVIKKDRYAKVGWDETMLDSIYDLCYAVPNLTVEGVDVPQPIPVSFMRSVGSTASVFFLESFINQLADTAHMDPVVYRKKLLAHDPLSLAVIDQTTAHAGWSAEPSPGRHRGFAFSVYTGRGDAFMTYVAVVAEVRIVHGQFKVERVVCGVDCGRAINPNLIREVIEGGIGFALTNTFKSQITFADGAVVQSNFPDYPLLSLSEMPKVEVVIVDSDRPPQGCGEVALPPVAPAVAHAIYRATNFRLRSMPLPQTVEDARLQV